MKVKELTKYPKLFSCYWGNFDAEKNTDIITPEIIENRNKFVAEFGIKQAKIPKTVSDLMLGLSQYNHPFFDHLEAYVTKDGNFVVICSSYGSPEDPEKDDFEFIPYKNKLYSTSTTTYFRVFYTMERVRFVLKTLQSKKR